MKRKLILTLILYVIALLTIAIAMFLMDYYLHSDDIATVLSSIDSYVPIIIYISFMVFDFLVFKKCDRTKPDKVDILFNIYVPISLTVLFFFASIVRTDWDWGLFRELLFLAIFVPLILYTLFITFIKGILMNPVFKYAKYLFFFMIHVFLYLIYFVVTFTQFV